MRSIPRSPVGVFVVLLALLAGWLLAEIEKQPEHGAEHSKRVAVTLDEVVDGDTARFWLDGKSESVRYIGIDTPEVNYGANDPECFAQDATNRNRLLLGSGGKATLLFDKERRDHYGRLLAYVYSGPTLLQEELLKGGYARTLEVPPNTSKAERFAQLENEARDSKRGLWSEC